MRVRGWGLASGEQQTLNRQPRVSINKAFRKIGGRPTTASSELIQVFPVDARLLMQPIKNGGALTFNEVT